MNKFILGITASSLLMSNIYAFDIKPIYFDNYKNIIKDYSIQSKSNIKELDDKYIIKFIVSGAEKKDIKIISQDNNYLEISYELNPEQTFSGTKESFKQLIRLKNMDLNKIKADLKNGILNIEVGKKEVNTKVITIE